MWWWLRALIGGISATRYLISLLVLTVVLIYAVLTFVQVAPFYRELAEAHGMWPPLLFFLLYLAVALLLAVLWHALVMRQGASVANLLTWRPLYRQTDSSGLLVLNFLLLAAGAGAIGIARFTFRSQAAWEVSIFLVCLVALPVLWDFAPAQRPRRRVVRAGVIAGARQGNAPADQAAESLTEIARSIVMPGYTVEEVAELLELYNELGTQALESSDISQPLPQALLLEIPPTLHHIAGTSAPSPVRPMVPPAVAQPEPEEPEIEL